MSYVLALLFAVSFLPQGLFYRHEFLPAVALLGAWLLARAWRNHEKVSLRLYGGPALLLIGYLLSLLDALRPADTWMAVAQIAVLFGLLMSASTERDPRTVLRGIAAAALIGAVYALLVRGGFWHDPAAYTPPFLTGSIQYHNAFGAAMALGLMVLYALAGDEKSEWWRSAYAAVGVPLALALYLSLSRGVYVLFPLAFILLFGVLDPLGRRRVAAVGLVGLVLGLVLIGPVSQAADHRSMAMFLWLLAAMALAYVAALGLNRLPHLLFGRRAMQAYLGIIVVLVAFGGLLARSKVLHLLARLAPAGVGSRVGAISIHSATLFDRLIMDGMALRLILGHPLIGYGANAWIDLYHRYQTSYFIANETHSFVTQVFLEGGIVAGAGLVWLLWLLLKRTFTRGRDGRLQRLRLGAAVAGLFLLAHSAMDFDLSYFSLLAMFFYLAGVATGGEEEGKGRWALPVRSVVYPLAALGLVLALPLAWGEKNYTDGLRALQRGRFQVAAREMRTAERFDPVDGRIPLWQAKLLELTSPLRAETYLRRAMVLLPDNSHVLVGVMEAAVQNRSFSFGAPAAIRAAALEPLRADTYWYGAQILPEAALTALASHRTALAHKDVRAIARLVHTYRQVGAASLYVNLTTVPLPQDLPLVMDMATGQEDALTGHLKAAERLLWAAHADIALRPRSDIWLYAVASSLHDAHYMSLVADQPWVLWRTVNPDFVALQEFLPKPRKSHL